MFKQRADQIQKIESAIDLTYFVCSILSAPTKVDLQQILDIDSASERMALVAALVAKELN